MQLFLVKINVGLLFI